MKYSRLVFVAFFLQGMAITSTGQKGPDISKTKERHLKFDASFYADSIRLPFKRIEVVDYRFDTTKIGYANNRTDTRLTVQSGLQDGLNKYLNNYYKNNLDTFSSETLLIIIKKLWLQYGATNQILRSKKIYFGSIMNYLPKNTICIASIDAFIGSETYQALLRIDHNFYIDQNDDKDDLSLLMLPFDSLMQGLRSINIETVLPKKKNFSSQDIFLVYQARFNLPILKEEKLSRGVYLSFDDFKNKRISYPDFKWEKTKYSMDVLIKKDGQETIFIEYWGFFDGKDLYIKPNLVPFKAIRKGNSFDLYGNLRNENYNYHITTNVQLALLTADPYSDYIAGYPLQIDMETGKVY